jgi:hypothetical protein
MVTRLLALLVLLIASAPVGEARAEIAAIPGWTRGNDATTVVMTSPADGNGYQVAYIVPQVAEVAGDPEAWFAEVTAGVLADLGTVFSTSGLRYDQDILTQVFLLRRQDGAEIYTFFAAYPTKRGYQLLILFYPLALGGQDSRVSQALMHMAAAWRSRFQLTSAGGQLLEAAVPPPPSAGE